MGWPQVQSIYLAAIQATGRSKLDWDRTPVHGKDFKGCPSGFNLRDSYF